MPEIKEHTLMKMTTTDKAMQVVAPFLRKNRELLLGMKEKPQNALRILSTLLTKIKVSEMEVFEICAYLETKLASELGTEDDLLWALRLLNFEIRNGNKI
jgi:hypothetical protein